MVSVKLLNIGSRRAVDDEDDEDVEIEGDEEVLVPPPLYSLVYSRTG